MAKMNWDRVRRENLASKPASGKAPRPAKGIEARYGGECGRCHKRYGVGAKIMPPLFGSKLWRHAACRPAA